MALCFTKTALIRLLEEDLALREDAENGLPTKNYIVSDPSGFRGAWKEELPTVVSRTTRCTLASADDVWKALKKAQPLLDVESIRNGTFTISGGSVTRALTGFVIDKEMDIDLFYAGDSASATPALRKLLQEMDDKFVRLKIFKALRFSQHLVVKYVSTITTDEETQKYEFDVDEVVEEFMQKWTPGTNIIDFLTTAQVRDHVWFKASDFRHCVEPTHPAGLSEAKWREFIKSQRLKGSTERGLALWYEMLRTKNAITIRPTECGSPIQVILRAYQRVEHIPLGFDLGSSGASLILNRSLVSSDAVYPEGDAGSAHLPEGEGPLIQFSPMGWFAHVTGYNVVDTTRLSTTFARRLFKYMGRGYGFILPNLNLDELPRENLTHRLPQYLALPHLPMVIERIVGQSMFIRDKSDWEIAKCGLFADYTLEELSRSRVVAQNIQMLIEGGDNFALHINCCDKRASNILAVIDEKPEVTPRMLTNRFDCLVESIWHNQRLNFTEFKRHLGPPEPSKAIDQPAGAEPLKLPTMTIEEFIGLEQNLRGSGEQAIRETLAKRRHILLDAWEKIPDEQKGTCWLVEHPCSQKKNYRFTGSMRPIFMSPEEWYGRFFKE